MIEVKRKEWKTICWPVDRNYARWERRYLHEWIFMPPNKQIEVELPSVQLTCSSIWFARTRSIGSDVAVEEAYGWEKGFGRFSNGGQVA